MKKIIVTGLFNTTTLFVFGQNTDAIINAKEVSRIENVLASDDMKGRKVFTPDIDRAADFIADEFKKAGLQTFNNKTYKQGFAMVRPKFISVSVTLDDNTVDPKNIIVITCQPELTIDQNSGYEIVKIDTGGSPYRDGDLGPRRQRQPPLQPEEMLRRWLRLAERRCLRAFQRCARPGSA